MSAAEAAAVLVLHPEPAAAAGETASCDAAAAAAVGEAGGGVEGGSSGLGSGGVGGGVGGSVSGSGGGGCRGGGGRDDGASALKMQTVMALTAQLMGRRAAVVQVRPPPPLREVCGPVGAVTMGLTRNTIVLLGVSVGGEIICGVVCACVVRVGVLCSSRGYGCCMQIRTQLLQLDISLTSHVIGDQQLRDAGGGGMMG